MKKLLFIAICILLVLSVVLVACGTQPPQDVTKGDDTAIDGSVDDGFDGDSNSGGSSGNNDSDTSTPDTQDENAIFDALFNKQNHISIRLDMSDKEMQKLQNDYESYSSRGSKSPIYRMADLHVAITDTDGKRSEYTIEQVGVRMKGNTSRDSFFNQSEGMYNLIHFKLDFGETFDDEEYYGEDAIVWESKEIRKERKDRTFATLEKLDLKWNRNFDTTYVKEGYAYDFYRDEGVIAPHTNLVSLDINKDHAGVFSIYEPIDELFLEKNLPEEALGGDLYKLGWTNEGATFTSFSSYGVEDEDKGQFFVYDLKTNKKKSDHSSLKNLIQVLNSTGLTKQQFETVVDVDNFIAYSAVSYILGNPDDLRNNYNNTYVYFRKDNGKMIVIPYDLDRVFGVNVWNPYGNGNVSDNPFQTYNVCGDQKSPLFSKTIQQGGFLMDEFAKGLSVVKDNEMLNPGNFKTAYDVAKANYNGEAKPSKDYHNASRSLFYFDVLQTCNPSESKNMSFEDYITQKLATLSRYVSDTGEIVDGRMLYVRGDFNGWNLDARYLMNKVSDGVYSFDISKDFDMSLKIFVEDTDSWYGAEFVDKKCTVAYESSTENKNLKLKKGSYTLYFYTDTNTINIVEK